VLQYYTIRFLEKCLTRFKFDKGKLNTSCAKRILVTRNKARGNQEAIAALATPDIGCLQ